MSKYDKAIKKVSLDEEAKKEQEDLHKKYKEIDKSIVIKEKSNTAKFMITATKNLIKIIVTIIIITLATIGLLTLIYPEIREAFFNIFFL